MVKTNETELGKKLRLDREDAHYTNIADVSYNDLEHFISNCRRMKDENSFNTAIKILTAIKRQVTGK